MCCTKQECDKCHRWVNVRYSVEVVDEPGIADGEYWYCGPCSNGIPPEKVFDPQHNTVVVAVFNVNHDWVDQLKGELSGQQVGEMVSFTTTQV